MKINETAIDFIGDIHGHAEALGQLLRKLGYQYTSGYFQHPERKAFFVGDFIDRGPQIKEVLEIVRPMIDNGTAYAVIGNHEYNAICYWTKGIDGKYLREHTEKNTGQHKKTIESLSPALLSEYVEWFKTLPIFFEGESFRVVHAQWHEEYITELNSSGHYNFADESFLIKSTINGSLEYRMIDVLLKGEELPVPEVSFTDKDGNLRSSYRLKWWLSGNSLKGKACLFEFPEHNDYIFSTPLAGYDVSDVPVFFGHYWLKNHHPVLQQKNVCCLDFSVAKGGILAAYQWDGEQQLDSTKFVWI